MATDETVSFEVEREKNIQAKEILQKVYEALVEKGYNPINQIVGYILSGDPTYITSHNNARNLIRKLEHEFSWTHRRSDEELFPMIDVYRSSPFFLEIVPKGIDKANSLETLGHIIGIRQEEMAAFGDGHNDINMIKYAGWGVAMSNACDEAKNIADFISLSNDECGVAHAIKELGL
mgnify:CR=1 FL=1